MDTHASTRFIPTRVGIPRTSRDRSYRSSVHPHTRGESGTETPVAGIDHGSSPHAWGIQQLGWLETVAGRFIPTRVGIPQQDPLPVPWAPVHPHTRGDSRKRTQSLTRFPGPSPHAWGFRGGRQGELADHRFIPTRVGIPQTRPRTGARASVHPHTRGDSVTLGQAEANETGSSPHAWGFRRRDRGLGQGRRFIPTRVGIPSSATGATTATTVHPHTRGDSPSASCPSATSTGSSPHAWGFQPLADDRRHGGRFIPTRVGNPWAEGYPAPPLPVHPHTRGESMVKAVAPMVSVGSSPHAWGFRQAGGVHRARRRSIPTRVGIPTRRASPNTAFAVHPHTRGDSRSWRVCSSSCCGPSPHAWGFLRSAAVTISACRSIPTRVGIPSRLPSPSCSPPVHPHTRGDSNLNGKIDMRHNGPSPHAWGFLVVVVPEVPVGRSIPTRVGIPLLLQALCRRLLRFYAVGDASRGYSMSVRPSKSRGPRLLSPAHRMANPCSV